MDSQRVQLETPEGVTLDVDVDFEVIREQVDCGERGGANVLTVNIPDDVTDVNSLKYLVSYKAIEDATEKLNREWA